MSRLSSAVKLIKEARPDRLRSGAAGSKPSERTKPVPLPSGAVVLVTGAGSGIGKATALAFAAEGALVLAVDVDEERAAETERACKEAGAQSASFACDVADWEQVVSLADRVHDEYGALDVLVNNAGVGMTGHLGDMTVADWRFIRSINIDGVVHGCLAFGPAMVERGRGHVANLSSGLGYTPRASEPAYVTTKAAVLGLSQSLRADWEPKGVNVVAICPGVINTPIIKATRIAGAGDERAESERRRNLEKLFSKGHPPELVARAIVESVGKGAAVIPVGWEAKLGWWIHRLGPLGLQQALARREG